jgi:hypothetical protein
VGVQAPAMNTRQQRSVHLRRIDILVERAPPAFRREPEQPQATARGEAENPIQCAAVEAPAGDDGLSPDAPVDCIAVCDYDAEPTCLDVSLDGAMGCCWLMLAPHPCCDWTPPIEAE